MFKEIKLLSRIAWGATILWGAVVFLLFKYRCEIELAFNLKLNEVGDFLSGATAPLAFLWIVVGYFQQNKELRQNNQALYLQIKELQNSVKQQEELVSATREDVEINRRAVESQIIRDEIESMPLFNFRVPLGGEKTQVHEVELKNSRAKAIDVKLSTEPPDIVCSPSSFKTIDNYHSYEINIEVPKRLGVGFTGKLTIHYKTVIDHYHFSEFQIVRDKDGSLKIFEDNEGA